MPQHPSRGRNSHGLHRTLLLPVLGLAAALSGPAVRAQEKYPSRPLTIIIPFGPGSSTDIGARQLAGKMQPRFGQNILIENRAGGNGTIGVALTVRARPDGYTILYGTSGSVGTAPALVKNLPYDPVRDLAGISIVNEAYVALLSRNEFRGTGFAQFLERMRREPERFAIGGQAATYQVLNHIIRESAGLRHEWIPYAEAGRMMNDLWGGRLGGVLISLNQALPTIKTQGHIVAHSGTERFAALPDTPLMQDTVPGAVLNSWTGYFAPARTPRPVIAVLHAHITETNRDPEVLRRNADGGRALFLSPEETDAYVKKEVPRWTALLKAAGIEPE